MSLVSFFTLQSNQEEDFLGCFQVDDTTGGTIFGMMFYLICLWYLLDHGGAETSTYGAKQFFPSTGNILVSSGYGSPLGHLLLCPTLLAIQVQVLSVEGIHAILVSLPGNPFACFWCSQVEHFSQDIWRTRSRLWLRCGSPFPLVLICLICAK